VHSSIIKGPTRFSIYNLYCTMTIRSWNRLTICKMCLFSKAWYATVLLERFKNQAYYLSSLQMQLSGLAWLTLLSTIVDVKQSSKLTVRLFSSSDYVLRCHQESHPYFSLLTVHFSANQITLFSRTPPWIDLYTMKLRPTRPFLIYRHVVLFISISCAFNNTRASLISCNYS
jgi:hypothetical protein